MSKRKRQARTKLAGKSRLKDAIRWLESRDTPARLVEEYRRRYSVSETTARTELMTIGYRDEVSIQEHEDSGTKWEYLMNPLTGELVVVPEGTEEHRLFEDDQLF